MNSVMTTESFDLVSHARNTIRAIGYDGNRTDLCKALEAIIACSKAHGWNRHTCKNQIFKAWGKKDRAGATVRRRRNQVMKSLACLVDAVYDAEKKVREIDFKNLKVVPELNNTSEIAATETRQ